MAVKSKRLRFEILKRDGFRCRYCGATSEGAKLHVDHVIPEAGGGTDDPANLVAACAACNGGKSDIRLEEARIAEETAEEKLRQSINAVDYVREALRGVRAKTRVPECLAGYFAGLYEVSPRYDSDIIRQKISDWLILSGVIADTFHGEETQHIRDVCLWMLWEQDVQPRLLVNAVLALETHYYTHDVDGALREIDRLPLHVAQSLVDAVAVEGFDCQQAIDYWRGQSSTGPLVSRLNCMGQR